MARGGHAKSGPLGFDQARRELRGTRTRAHHRTKGSVGTPMVVCEAPGHLTTTERLLWRYYAPLLVAADRLTLEARDVLSKYCTALAIIQRLKKQMAAKEYKDVMVSVTVDGAGNQHHNAKPNPLLLQLRQWILVCRGYESDLLLAPSAAVRAPKPAAPEPTDEETELDAILN